MSPLMKRRVENIRSELAKTESGGRRNIAGERAVARLGIDGARTLLARADSGDDVTDELRSACRE